MSVAALDPHGLLGAHRPVVQYDSLESYYADWAAVITDRPGNVLRRADGTLLAVAGPPTAGLPQLSLAFLQPHAYPSGEPVQSGDAIVEVGSDYVAQAREMHARPGYANKAHGRVVVQGGVTWLQYWLFMYYDDPGFLGLGRHQGDVEMIEIRLDAHGTPDAAAYAQHRSGVRANWDAVEREGDAPVVYSARGTHASMLRHGELISDRSFLPDHNDARGPRVRPDLVALSDTQTPWALWPGSWGATKPEDQILGNVGVEASSPRGPVGHRAWTDPAGFYAACDDADAPPIGSPHVSASPAPPAPRLHIDVDSAAGLARVSYTVDSGAVAPSRLVVGLDTSNGRLPPATTSVALTGTTGSLTARLPAGATSVQVRATAHAPDGTASATTTASAQ